MRKKIYIGLFVLFCIAVISACSLFEGAFKAKYEGETMTTRDGKKLITLVHLPKGKGPFPTLIVRSPYELPHTTLAGMDTLNLEGVPDSKLGEMGWPEITEAGYALVIQHTRGRVGSEGIALDLQDRNDGVDLINWVKKQSWSNGKIGTMGDSIEAILAMLLNAEKSDGLDASWAQVGTPNLVNEALLGPGGALKWETMFPWTAEQILTADANHYDEIGYGRMKTNIARAKMLRKVMRVLGDLENPNEVKDWKHLPLLDYPDFSDASSSWNAFLEARPNSLAAKHFDASASTVPTYYATPWYDVFSPSQISAFERGEKDNLNQRLLILNGTHFTPENPKAWPIKPLLPWFDYHLKGEKSALLDLPRVIFPVANAEDEWYGTDTWPPKPTKSQKWYLVKNGNITTSNDASSEAETRSFQYDPENPVPTIGGRNLMISHGPLDQQTIREGKRADVLSYNSSPLDEAVLIAGHVYSTLSVSSDCPDTDFTVKILDISPDGTATLVTEGILRARFREGLNKEVFMKTGEVYQLNLDLGHIAWRVKPGHRIGVDISSSNFPQWDRNLNTNQPLFTSKEMQIANNTVHHNTVNASFIELPILSDVKELERLKGFKTNVSD